MSSGEQFKYVSCYAHKGYFKSFKGVLFQRGCNSALGSKNDNDTSKFKTKHSSTNCITQICFEA